MIGWTPRSDGRIKRWGFSVAKYGPQDQVECDLYGPLPPWCSNDSGNGRCESVPNPSQTYCVDGRIVGNDPTDTSEPIGPPFIAGWMAHLASRVGSAGAGGVRLWALDNEPMLWYETYRDVAPMPLDFDGLWSRTVAVAAAMKAADPDALVLGPVFWVWCAYFTSAAGSTATVPGSASPSWSIAGAPTMVPAPPSPTPRPSPCSAARA